MPSSWLSSFCPARAPIEFVPFTVCLEAILTATHLSTYQVLTRFQYASSTALFVEIYTSLCGGSGFRQPGIPSRSHCEGMLHFTPSKQASQPPEQHSHHSERLSLVHNRRTVPVWSSPSMFLFSADTTVLPFSCLNRVHVSLLGRRCVCGNMSAGIS